MAGLCTNSCVEVQVASKYYQNRVVVPCRVQTIPEILAVTQSEHGANPEHLTYHYSASEEVEIAPTRREEEVLCKS